MENGRHIAIEMAAAIDSLKQLAGFNIVGELQRSQIPPLLVLTQDIGHQDVLESAAVQLPGECAADKTGASGDENSALCQVCHYRSLNLHRSFARILRAPDY